MNKKFSLCSKAPPEILVERWNAEHAIGARVQVKRDDGTFTETFTRSEAQFLGGHTAVIWLEGISGAYALDRVTALNEKFPTAAPPAPEGLTSMHHFLKLARRGRPGTGASTGEVKARRLATAIIEHSPGLDSQAIEGAAEFLRRAALDLRAARALIEPALEVAS